MYHTSPSLSPNSPSTQQTNGRYHKTNSDSGLSLKSSNRSGYEDGSSMRSKRQPSQEEAVNTISSKWREFKAKRKGWKFGRRSNTKDDDYKESEYDNDDDEDSGTEYNSMFGSDKMSSHHGDQHHIPGGGKYSSKRNKKRKQKYYEQEDADNLYDYSAGHSSLNPVMG